jgi:hypothetical protein
MDVFRAFTPPRAAPNLNLVGVYPNVLPDARTRSRVTVIA